MTIETPVQLPWFGTTLRERERLLRVVVVEGHHGGGPHAGALATLWHPDHGFRVLHRFAGMDDHVSHDFAGLTKEQAFYLSSALERSMSRGGVVTVFEDAERAAVALSHLVE